MSEKSTGLRNEGNDCYLNAVLQCMLNCTTLANFFIDNVYDRELGEQEKNNTLARELSNLFKQMRSGTQNLTPAALKAAFVKVQAEFDNSQQHDAQEAFTYILDALHEAVKQPDGRSTIKDIFQGQLKDTLECTACQETNDIAQPFICLDLPVLTEQGEELQNVASCLHAFRQPDDLEGGMQCPRCRTRQPARKTTEPFTSADYLIISLKRHRFVNGNIEKVTHKVHAPERGLRLRRVEGDDGAVFDLHAVIDHHGGYGAGHYIAKCRKGNGTWMTYNDEQVDRSGTVVSAQAYMLFYRRQPTGARSSPDVPFLPRIPSTIPRASRKIRTERFEPLPANQPAGEKLRLASMLEQLTPDTTILANEALLAEFKMKPSDLSIDQVKEDMDWRLPLIKLMRDREAKELIEGLVESLEASRISERNLARAKEVVPWLNTRLVDALEQAKNRTRHLPQQWTPLLSLSTDGSANLIKNAQGKTNFVDELVLRPPECKGYSPWELFHATVFDENESLALAYSDMERSRGFLDLDAITANALPDGEDPDYAAAVYCLKFPHGKRYIGQSDNPGRRKTEHATDQETGEGVNQHVAQLHAEGKQHEFTVLHHLRCCTNNITRQALETSLIAAAGTTIESIPGRARGRMQDQIVSATGFGLLPPTFPLELARASLLRYMTCAFSEGRAGRSTLPPRSWETLNPREQQNTAIWNEILGEHIVARINSKGWTTQEFCWWLFSNDMKPLLEALESTHGQVDRLTVHARMSNTAGKVLGADRDVRAVMKLGVDRAASRDAVRPAMWTARARHGRYRTISDDFLQSDAQVWKEIFRLLDSKVTHQDPNIDIDLRILSTSTQPTSSSSMKPAKPHNTMASLAKVDVQPATSFRDPPSDEDRRERAAYIVAVAEKMWFDWSHRVEGVNVGLEIGYYRVVTKRRDSKKRPGLLENLNFLGTTFSLEEVDRALDGSTSITRSRNSLVRHKAAKGEELERRSEACRVAAREIGLGDDASDEFIVYLAHSLGIAWKHWLWSDKEYNQHPNIYHRYILGEQPPTLAYLEDTVAAAILDWGLGLCEDDVRALVQCRFKTWNAVLEDIIGRACVSSSVLKPLLENLRQNSQKYGKFDLEDPSESDRDFIARCDELHRQRRNAQKSRTDSKSVTTPDATIFIRQQIAEKACAIWDVSEETFLAWADAPSLQGTPSTFRDRKRTMLRVLMRVLLGICPAYDLTGVRVAEEIFTFDGLFPQIERDRLPRRFIEAPAQRALLEEVLDSVSQTQDSPWQSLNQCHTAESRIQRRNVIVNAPDTLFTVYRAYCLKLNLTPRPRQSNEYEIFRHQVVLYLSTHAFWRQDGGYHEWQISEYTTICLFWWYYGDIPEAIEILSRALDRAPTAIQDLISHLRPDFLDNRRRPTMGRMPGQLANPLFNQPPSPERQPQVLGQPEHEASLTDPELDSGWALGEEQDTSKRSTGEVDSGWALAPEKVLKDGSGSDTSSGDDSEALQDEAGLELEDSGWALGDDWSDGSESDSGWALGDDWSDGSESDSGGTLDSAEEQPTDNPSTGKRRLAKPKAGNAARGEAKHQDRLCKETRDSRLSDIRVKQKTTRERTKTMKAAGGRSHDLKKEVAADEDKCSIRIATSDDFSLDCWLRPTSGIIKGKVKLILKTTEESFPLVAGYRQSPVTRPCYRCALAQVVCRFNGEDPCDRCASANIRCCSFVISTPVSQ